MKKKGFTLIELLAVIIILAIIALIATPIILNVIEDARKSAGRSETEMIMSGINNYCATSAMKNQLDGTEDICNDEDGVTITDVSKMVNLGNAEVLEVEYQDGKVTKLKVKSNNYEFELQADGSFSINGESTEPDNPKPDDSEETGGNLISTLLEKADTTGLVQDETDSNIYYYTGGNDVVTNHLWYGGHHWRILEIDTDANTLLLVSQQPLVALPSASDGWDTKEKYENSYVNTWINKYFYNTFSDDVKNSIIDNTFNVGIYTDVDEITTNQKVGLLDEDQYERAGGQDSYLDIKDYFWLINRYDSDYIRYVDDNGIIANEWLPGVGLGIRPVIKISDITIIGGDGTLSSNYKTADKATNTNDVQVGEYINVPYSGSDSACGDDNLCTFRVVSKDNDSIKVTLNGLLPTESRYGDTVRITINHTVYTPLKQFSNNISDDYRYIQDKEFIIGGFGGYMSYEDIPKEILNANVGLPTVGEIFTGNDIDMGNTKTFVEDDIIENSKVGEVYWTMNWSFQNNVRAVFDIGSLGTSFGNSIGVRPVIFLKNNLNFVSGDGTAQSPYELQ